jgi:hypothetical protein
MDCNSIIYDAFHNLEKQDFYINMDLTEIERYIIDEVIVNIKKYIHFINPSTNIYIAFDGVAPFAKMEQQRTRRYKSQYLATLPFITKTSRWNTASITPGTNFMNTLSSRISCEFESKADQYGVKQIIVSGSTIPGEGEHKMYEHLRETAITEDNVAIYGLDSDLIMLSIFHSIYCNNIYIFREAIELDATALKQTSHTHQKVAAAAIKEEREKIRKTSYAGRSARAVHLHDEKVAKKSWKDKPLSAGQKCFNCPATHKVFECDDACRLSTCTIPTEKHAAKDCPSIFNDALFQQLLKVRYNLDTICSYPTILTCLSSRSGRPLKRAARAR